MKIIFLDIDGVLDIFNTEELLQELLEPALLRLRKIVTETDAKKMWVDQIVDFNSQRSEQKNNQKEILQ